MADLELFWCHQTRASRTVWLLEEAGVEYAVTPIDIRSEEEKAHPGFRAASPFGKVPAIRHSDVTLCDSNAIAFYIAETFPEAGLAPPVGDPRRADFLFWMIYGGTYIEPAMIEGFGAHPPNKAAYGYGDFPSVIETIRNGLKDGPWLLGDEFSAADTLVGSGVVFMRMFGILPDHEDLNAYADRCLARPGYAKAMKMDADAAVDTESG